MGLLNNHEETSSREKMIIYRDICLKHNRILSFYELEKLEKIPATRYKRMFNADMPYSHLKNDLEKHLLSENEDFIKWLDKNF